MSKELNPSLQRLKQKSDLHLSRKFWHCVGICGMAAAYALMPNRMAWIALFALSAFIIPLDLLRLKFPRLNRNAMRIFGSVMRRHETDSLSGFSFLLLGAIFLLWLNQFHIVTLTLLFLAFGDPVASFFGLRFGKDKILGSKTLQGTMAAFIICTLISAIYYYFNNIMTERLLIVAPLSGLIGAAAELIPIGKIDDNLSFPVLGASLLWLLFTVYGGFGI
jgi:dolichol kinase